MISTSTNQLEATLERIVPYLTVVEMITIGSSCKAARLWLEEALTRQGFMTLHIPSDRVCSSALLPSILASTKRRRIILGSEITDDGCNALAPLLHLPEEKVSAEIDLSAANQVTQEGFDNIFMKSFTAINLSSVWRAGDDVIQQFCKFSREIQKLNLSRCYRISDGAARLLHGLTVLYLERCVNVLQPETFAIIAENNPNLRELNLSGLVNMVTDEALISAPVLQSLEHLNLDGATQLTDDGIIQLCRIAPKLRFLSLARCTKLTDFQSLGMGLKYLQSLDLSCTAVSASSLSKVIDFPALRCLHLKQTRIDDECLRSIALLQNLEVLSLTGCDCITGTGLQHLSHFRNSLREINLSSCSNVTTDGLESLLEAHGETLEVLHLPPCTDDQTLRTAGISLHRLHTVDFGRSFKVTSCGAIALAACCRKTLVDIRADETSIGDEFLEYLAAVPHLVRLSAYNCVNTTAAAFARLDSSLKTTRLRFLMDSEGRMLRCPCCAHARNCESASSPATTISMKPSPSTFSVMGDERFTNLEAPFLVLSSLVLLADWFLS